MFNNDSIAIFMATNGWLVRFVTWEPVEEDADQYKDANSEDIVAPPSVIRSMRQEAKVYRAICYTRDEVMNAVRGYATELGPMPPLSVQVIPGIRPFDGLSKPWACLTKISTTGFQIEICSTATFSKEAKEALKKPDDDDEPDHRHEHSLYIFKTQPELEVFLNKALPDPESPSVPPTTTEYIQATQKYGQGRPE